MHHNFSGGPGALPESVLREASQAVTEVAGEGVSILGISHRSSWFRNVLDEAEENIRGLLSIPPEYRIMFLQGGATLQFSMVPMTLLRGRSDPAEYLHTGYWSGKSITEARREGPVRILKGSSLNFGALPSASELESQHHQNAPYLHYVSNETVEGLQFHRTVGRDDVMRVCDMSSDFLSRPFDINKYVIVYAHAQKNLGPAGVTVVILREDILSRVSDDMPAMLDYREHANMRSVYNTPPVFAIYITMLVLRWLRKEIGGLEAMDAMNQAKAAALYSALDASHNFYRGHAAVRDRSLMNAAFRLPTVRLEQSFLEQAKNHGLYGLEGHRSIGGIRASLYNAVTIEAVMNLCAFMENFQQQHGRESELNESASMKAAL